MSIDILRLFAFDGPNIVSPNPGVLLDARADGDLRVGLRNALKDAGQHIGVVIGGLTVDGAPSLNGFTLRLSFATPTPALGAAIVRYAIDGLNAFAAGDTEWDGDELRWQLQQRRRSEALPFGAIQVIAEAQQRGIPAFRRADGRLQLGYGVRGIAIELAPLAEASGSAGLGMGAIPWERLGHIPIVAISGRGVDGTAAAAIADRAGRTSVLRQADFSTARALLCEPDLESAIIELTAESLLVHGLPFDRCAACIIGGLPEQVTAAFDRDELARAIALPLLVTLPAGRAQIDDVPELRALATYAACQVSYFYHQEHEESEGTTDP